MNSKYFQEDKWWVSPYNFVDEVTAKFDLPQKVEIHDATLRDGEQTPGVWWWWSGPARSTIRRQPTTTPVACAGYASDWTTAC